MPKETVWTAMLRALGSGIGAYPQLLKQQTAMQGQQDAQMADVYGGLIGIEQNKARQKETERHNLSLEELRQQEIEAKKKEGPAQPTNFTPLGLLTYDSMNPGVLPPELRNYAKMKMKAEEGDISRSEFEASLGEDIAALEEAGKEVPPWMWKLYGRQDKAERTGPTGMQTSALVNQVLGERRKRFEGEGGYVPSRDTAAYNETFTTPYRKRVTDSLEYIRPEAYQGQSGGLQDMSDADLDALLQQLYEEAKQ